MNQVGFRSSASYQEILFTNLTFQFCSYRPLLVPRISHITLNLKKCVRLKSTLFSPIHFLHSPKLQNFLGCNTHTLSPLSLLLSLSPFLSRPISTTPLSISSGSQTKTQSNNISHLAPFKTNEAGSAGAGGLRTPTPYPSNPHACPHSTFSQAPTPRMLLLLLRRRMRRRFDGPNPDFFVRQASCGGGVVISIVGVHLEKVVEHYEEHG